MTKALDAQLSFKPSKPERLVQAILEESKVQFERNKHLYGKFFVDFAITGTNIVIEVFGDYWHGHPVRFPEPNAHQQRQMAKDRGRLAYLRKCGHKVIVLWESQVKDNGPTIQRIAARLAARQRKPHGTDRQHHDHRAA